MMNSFPFPPSGCGPQFDLGEHHYEVWISRQSLPVIGSDDTFVILTADQSAENLSWLQAAYPGWRIVSASPACLQGEFIRRFGTQMAEESAHQLARNTPALSASTVVTPGQCVAAAGVVALVVLSLTAWPLATCSALVALSSFAFVGGMLFRAFLAWAGGSDRGQTSSYEGGDEFLPVYTILVPMYHEAEVLPRLVRSLLLLDYPRDKLDIKLIVEADDFDTARVADAMVGRGPFEVIRVPAGTPRTKPRACNYAFKFARGECTVIFDAEDRPERDQLRKAVAMFRSCSRDVACLQARLSFYNAHENWLTRLFALDYALWFDILLPGLEKLRVPMPLGGTSNHFRTSVLRAFGAWDPFNVTEDADLGIRMAQLGKRVAMLDSTTFEEAPTALPAWLKQRSRWLKGYMQTWLVHMRNPRTLLARSGWRGFCAFQLFLGGSVVAALVNPFLWLVFLLASAWPLPIFAALPEQAIAYSLVGLVSGNAIMIWLTLIAPWRRGWKGFAPYGFTVTLYWALISLAAYRGLWQLARRPFHWDKTVHGVSRLSRVPR